MLVLTRKVRQSIMIGDEILITVTHIAHGKIKLGVHVPENIRIVRSELMEVQNNSPPVPLRRSPSTVSPTFCESSVVIHNSPIDFTTEYATEIEDQKLLTFVG